jgi:hypothetical protein
MPFNRTDYTLLPPITQQTFYDAIKARLAVIGGYTLFSEYSASGDKIVVYELLSDSTKLFGKVYYRVRVTTGLQIFQQLYVTWNATTNTGTLPSTESTSISFASNVAIDFVTFGKLPEYRFLALSQNTTFALFGGLRPEIKSDGWSEDSYPWMFILDNDWTAANQFKKWLSCTSNPYSNTSGFTSNMADSRLSSQNPVTNKRDSQASMVIYSTTQGIAGQTSQEILTVAALGQTRFELIQFIAGTEEYILLNPGYGAMAIRK